MPYRVRDSCTVSSPFTAGIADRVGFEYILVSEDASL